jgi:hypothetical protein
MRSTRLPSVPLGDFTDSRWQRIRNDIDDFLGSPFAERAKGLGWTELDLFGVDNSRPYARIDQAGLVIMLDGYKIVELSAQTAILETAGGVRQSYHRKGDQPGRAVIWDLLRDGAR